MASSLDGRCALVTGGASGIGAALSAALTGGGAEVWIADRQIEVATELAQRLSTIGPGTAYPVELDTRSYSSFEQAVNDAVRQSKRIDFLFNNAGIGVGGEIDSYTLDDWYDVFEVNLRGIIHGIHAVYPIMIAAQSGHIVNTASMAGLVTTVGQAGYAATKHAIVAISKTMRVEARRHGVHVSVLCPGAVRTPILTGGMYGRNNGVTDSQLLRRAAAVRPLDPDVFAARALKAVLRDQAIIVLPGWWKSLWYLERLSPSLSMLGANLMLKRIRADQLSTL